MIALKLINIYKKKEKIEKNYIPLLIELSSVRKNNKNLIIKTKILILLIQVSPNRKKED